MEKPPVTESEHIHLLIYILDSNRVHRVHIPLYSIMAMNKQVVHGWVHSELYQTSNEANGVACILNKKRTNLMVNDMRASTVLI